MDIDISRIYQCVLLSTLEPGMAVSISSLLIDNLTIYSYLLMNADVDSGDVVVWWCEHPSSPGQQVMNRQVNRWKNSPTSSNKKNI